MHDGVVEEVQEVRNRGHAAAAPATAVETLGQMGETGMLRHCVSRVPHKEENDRKHEPHHHHCLDADTFLSFTILLLAKQIFGWTRVDNEWWW